jgi:TonB family protein
VLAEIHDGEIRTVTLSGIYATGYEHNIFYDPNTPVCIADVQPETWVQFASGVTNVDLTRLFERAEGSWETRRAYVTFSGEIHGPGIVAPDDTSFPGVAALANRARNRRYGHMGGHRTKFVVTSISDVKSVPDSVPWPSGPSSNPPRLVERAELPQYPPMAWNFGVTGDVILEVTVSGGRVVDVHVKSGDRMLSAEAIRNVKTWQLAAQTSATFTTTFSFDIEPRNTGESTSPRIELQLPENVRITAARNGW